MGGPCEEKISASTPEEMMSKGMAHIEAAHTEMAADIKAMSPEDPKMTEWRTKFDAEYAAAPEE